MNIINFEKEKIKKYLKGFLETGILPSLISEDQFLEEFKDIRTLCNYWQTSVEDDPVLTKIIWTMHDIFIEDKKKKINEELQESENPEIVRLRRIKKNFKTLNPIFRSPSVHSGYPFDENPVLILTYEASRAFHEKMGDYAVSKPNEINTFILAFVKKNRKEIIEAIEKDSIQLVNFIERLKKRQVDVNETTLTARALSEAIFKRDEFIVCLNTIHTILSQLPS